MKLKLTRTQSSGLTGKVKFKLHAIALLDEQELVAVKKYKLEREVVYSNTKVDPRNAGSMAGAIGRMAAAAALNIKLTVNDLVQGRVIECKEITEMLAVEDELRSACNVLVSILGAAAHFGGEEIIEITGA